MRKDPLRTQIVAFQTNIFVYIKANITWLDSPIEAAYIPDTISLSMTVEFQFMKRPTGGITFASAT